MRFLAVICCLLVQASLSAREQFPCMKALIVYDTSSSAISVATKADARRMEKAFRLMVQRNGVLFRPKMIRASKCTKKVLSAWLATLRASPDEGALFYYAGTGINRPGQAWPFIKLGKGRISEVTVAKKIAARRVGMNVVLFDCYARPLVPSDGIDPNTATKADFVRFGGGPLFKTSTRKNRRLFMGASGSNVSAALCSTSTRPIGGLFTTLFLRGATSWPR